jgi:hypothetical protein
MVKFSHTQKKNDRNNYFICEKNGLSLYVMMVLNPVKCVNFLLY